MIATSWCLIAFLSGESKNKGNIGIEWSFGVSPGSFEMSYYPPGNESISHLWKRKIIDSKVCWEMLVPKRVEYHITWKLIRLDELDSMNFPQNFKCFLKSAGHSWTFFCGNISTLYQPLCRFRGSPLDSSPCPPGRPAGWPGWGFWTATLSTSSALEQWPVDPG